MPKGVEIVGFGAGAHDFYRPVGDVDDDHVAGAKKATWTDREDQLLEELIKSGCEDHVGGNAVNALAYLACRSALRPNVSFVSALGHDRASDAIRHDLQRLGIQRITSESPDYLPSVSIIERKEVGGDRMVKGRPRTPLDAYISNAQILRATSNADAVVAASLKSVDLADRIFAQTPKDTFKAFNPGSSEFEKHPDALRELMENYYPDLLALNDDELRLLLGATEDANPFELAVEANRYARNVLCTLGKNGILLAHDHKVIYRQAETVPASSVIDTLGAGDRANGITIDGLLLKRSRHLILQDVAQGTAAVIQRVGAHGDL